MIFIVATAAILATMALALTRALLGPTFYDRVLAANMFGTKTVLAIAVIGFLTGRPDFLDLALLYAMLNFIGTLAILKFCEYGGFGPLPAGGDSLAASPEPLASPSDSPATPSGGEEGP